MNIPFSQSCPERLAASLCLALAASLFSVGSVGCDAAATSSAPPSPSASGSQGHDHAHAGHGATATDSRLILTTKPMPPEAGERTMIRVMIHRVDGSMVREFDTLHGKTLHLILIREGLDEFAHLHPEVDDAGNAKIEHAFPVGGRYFVYADYQPAGEGPATAKTTVDVGGESPAAPKRVPDVPGRVSGDGLTADVAIERRAKANPAQSSSLFSI